MPTRSMHRCISFLHRPKPTTTTSATPPSNKITKKNHPTLVLVVDTTTCSTARSRSSEYITYKVSDIEVGSELQQQLGGCHMTLSSCLVQRRLSSLHHGNSIIAIPWPVQPLARIWTSVQWLRQSMSRALAPSLHPNTHLIRFIDIGRVASQQVADGAQISSHRQPMQVGVIHCAQNNSNNSNSNNNNNEEDEEGTTRNKSDPK
jgi:hypothetical protein